MATKAQRSVFRHVLQKARSEAGLSQRELARRVEVSPGAVSQWETGETAPREDTTVALERVLELDAGALGSLLGYVPAAPGVERAAVSVAAAIEADSQLGPRDQRLLLALYRELVRTREGKPDA